MSDATSKRKRRTTKDFPSKIDTNFSLDFPNELPFPESHISPIKRVAYTFQGLQLSSPSSNFDLNDPSSQSEAPLTPSDERQKRVRVSDTPHIHSELEIPETPLQAQEFKIGFGHERVRDPLIQEKAEGVLSQNEVAKKKLSATSEEKTAGGKSNQRTKRLNNRPITTDPNPKKRAGTPPLQLNSKVLNPDISSASTFLDPDLDQADLTWHDDEITGNNPSDTEDDGVGLNGLGFQPSAAQTYQRIQKRKQQMADYKSREAKEARAKRGARRRGGGDDVVGEKRAVEIARRVRFSDGVETG